MPVRSLHSSVLKWPDKNAVDRAARAWAAEEAEQRPELKRLGYFGSYARGDWGVGSDLDLVAIVSQSTDPFESRSRSWPLDRLPVPAEILVYTATEWAALEKEGGRFIRMLQRETIWLIDASGSTRHKD